jgi:hypothetical protein
MSAARRERHEGIGERTTPGIHGNLRTRYGLALFHFFVGLETPILLERASRGLYTNIESRKTAGQCGKLLLKPKARWKVDAR